MNIFYLNTNPVICAQEHCDKHVVKMILEYAQLLSTAKRVLDGKEIIEISAAGRKLKRWKLDSELDNVIYKSTHINHPCNIWTRYSFDNYSFLVRLLEELCAEYTHRYGKVHLVERKELPGIFRLHTPKFINSGWTNPPLAMPDECKINDNPVLSYQKFYRKEKAYFAKWSKREIPSWFITND